MHEVQAQQHAASTWWIILELCMVYSYSVMRIAAISCCCLVPSGNQGNDRCVISCCFFVGANNQTTKSSSSSSLILLLLLLTMEGAVDGNTISHLHRVIHPISNNIRMSWLFPSSNKICSAQPHRTFHQHPPSYYNLQSGRLLTI